MGDVVPATKFRKPLQIGLERQLFRKKLNPRGQWARVPWADSTGALFWHRATAKQRYRQPRVGSSRLPAVTPWASPKAFSDGLNVAQKRGPSRNRKVRVPITRTPPTI